MKYPDLAEKVVLVTGGTGGIGGAIGKAFLACGSRVVLVGRNKSMLAQPHEEHSGKVSFIPFDVNDIARIPELVTLVIQKAGNVDVLINCAGVNLKKEALAVTDLEYMNVIHTNQTAVFVLTREIAKTMVEHKNGSVIMISSMASHYGIPKVVAYTASKSAIEGMTRALAVEWAANGVRVNCIAPGFIKTAMSSKALNNDPERKQRVLSRTPMGILGEPEDIANAALFLASSQSKFITGVVLPVDGGNSIGF